MLSREASSSTVNTITTSAMPTGLANGERNAASCASADSGVSFTASGAFEGAASFCRSFTASAALPSSPAGWRFSVRIFFVMTLAAVSGSMIFNFTTNGNNQLLAERLRGLVDDPARLGILLAVVYTIASFAQIVVGKLIDRYPLKFVYLPIVAAQVPLFLLAARAEGWALYALMLAFMVFVFGAIPFIDAMIVQYVDDRMRSRVAGMRLAVSFGVSALAVYLLGPTVKAAGFTTLLLLMAGISSLTTLFVSMLPGRVPTPAAAPAPAPAR